MINLFSGILLNKNSRLTISVIFTEMQHYKSKVYSKSFLITYDLNYITIDIKGNQKKYEKWMALGL